MRKVILQMQMSVDGYFAAVKPDLAWQVWDWGARWSWDELLKQDFNKTFASIDCILLSRNLAEEGYLTHWGNAANRFPADPCYAFARRIVDADKVVFSTKLETSKWERTRVAQKSLADEVAALKRRRGKNIIAFGGIRFASALVAEGLVDEFHLFVNPTAVGAGQSIFSERRGALPLELLRSQAYLCGIVVNCYAPRRKRGR